MLNIYYSVLFQLCIILVLFYDNSGCFILCILFKFLLLSGKFLGFSYCVIIENENQSVFVMKLDRCRYSIHKICMTLHISCLGSHLKVSENCS